MFSYEEIFYLKKDLKKLLVILFILFIPAYLAYSFDWDFPIRETLLKKDTNFYQDSITEIQTQKKNVTYNTELGLQIVGQIQITGSFEGANEEFLRTNCPFQKDKVEIYNNYFSAIILSINGKEQVFAVTPNSRLIKQILSKITNDKSYIFKKIKHKITLSGYSLHLQKQKVPPVPHILVTKIILDNKVYE